MSTKHTPKLFQPFQLGPMQLQHRVVMAPLTRGRSTKDHIPTDLMRQYYEQRASKGGLIITEATNISLQGTNWPQSPGIFNKEQVDAWKKVTDAVHAKGGYIFMQLWHTGRVSHPSFHPGIPTVSASAVKYSGKVFCGDEKCDAVVPKELTKDEIKSVVDDYANAAVNAKNAGFDGVEIHSANGYLLDQFLAVSVNKRTDEYGGSIENRCRIVFEVVDAICKAWGSQHTGIRFSPGGTFQDIDHGDVVTLFSHLVKQLNSRNLAYIHIIEPRLSYPKQEYAKECCPPSMCKVLRSIYEGTIIACAGFNRDTAIEYVEEGWSDCIAFGRWSISNPDLWIRLKMNYPLNPYDSKTFYTHGKEGYIDYPFFKEENY